MWTRTLFAPALALTLVAVSATAQEEEAPVESFFDVTDVEIVNVDVWVTDKSGQSVSGLGRDDFLVYRDGKPVEISNFYAVENGFPVGDEEIAPLPAPAAPEAGEPADQRLPEEHQLWMILYIDNYNIDPIERNRIFPALHSFLNQSLREGDQAMVVTYSRSLDVVQPFTDDIYRLTGSLEELEKKSGFAQIRKRRQFSTLQLIDRAGSANRALAHARQYAEEQMNNVGYTVAALERLIETLAGLPGRKALVHVSSGIPMTAGEEMFYAVAEKYNASTAYGEIPRHDTTRRFEKLNRYANAHRVAFYTVDAGGQRGMEFGNAEYSGFVDLSLRSTLDSVVPENLQAPLRFMALETGGQAIVNQNEILPALRKASQDFRTFYSLGITSTDVFEGRYHELKVKLSRDHKGLVVRHRGGYRSKSLESRVRETLVSGLLYSQDTNPLHVEVTWGRPEPHEDGTYMLPIQLRIPMSSVVLLPTEPGRHETRLRLFVAAVGDLGERSEIDTIPLGVRLADEHVEAAKKESLVHTHKLLLSPGKKRVGVAVLDLFGRQSSVVTESFQVGSE